MTTFNWIKIKLWVVADQRNIPPFTKKKKKYSSVRWGVTSKRSCGLFLYLLLASGSGRGCDRMKVFNQGEKSCYELS